MVVTNWNTLRFKQPDELVDDRLLLIGRKVNAT
jgi:hypothetical protein